MLLEVSTGVIMPELQNLCGAPVLPLSVEQPKVDPPEISIVALSPSSPLYSSQILDAEECGDLDVSISRSPKSIGVWLFGCFNISIS